MDNFLSTLPFNIPFPSSKITPSSNSVHYRKTISVNTRSEFSPNNLNSCALMKLAQALPRYLTGHWPCMC